MTDTQIKKQAEGYMANTYGRFNAVLVKGTGSRCEDINGKEYIDFTSGIGVNSLGYCNEKWVRAVEEQAGRLQHVSNLYYTMPQSLLAEKLCNASGFPKVFFANSGAEANEGAIKTARKYSYEKYGEGRNKIITLVNSFHGRTVTTLAATGQESMHEFFYPFTEGFVYAKANDIESVKKAAGIDVCAIMMELVQGEGGVLPLDLKFVEQVSALAQEKDILLIIDEVQTGIGRTGTLFAFQQYPVKPDIVSFAKGIGGGLPIGGFLMNEKCAGVLGKGQHGTTFGGNPVACAGALAVLDEVLRPSFLAAVAEKGEHIQKKLLGMKHISFVRGKGMMLGIGLEDEIKAADVAAACCEKGLLVLTAKTLLRLLPPLNISIEDIDQGLAILQSVLEEI